MTTLKLAVIPAKMLKNGRHKIRIAIGHNQETRYLVTRFDIDDISQFKDGQVTDLAVCFIDGEFTVKHVRLETQEESEEKIQTRTTCKVLYN